VAVFENLMAVEICGRESVLEGKMALIWQFKKLAL
jgi:hypothetical protein